MVQVAKSTNEFELFERRNPGTVRLSTENSKAPVILVRCAVFGPATAEFRFNLRKQLLKLLSMRGEEEAVVSKPVTVLYYKRVLHVLV